MTRNILKQWKTYKDRSRRFGKEYQIRAMAMIDLNDVTASDQKCFERVGRGAEAKSRGLWEEGFAGFCEFSRDRNVSILHIYCIAVIHTNQSTFAWFCYGMHTVLYYNRFISHSMYPQRIPNSHVDDKAEVLLPSLPGSCFWLKVSLMSNPYITCRALVLNFQTARFAAYASLKLLWKYWLEAAATANQ